MSMLKRGDRGDEVAQIQTKLNQQPSSLPQLDVDGIFGQKMQARVKEFQRQQQLDADGIVGPLTSAKLEQADVNPDRILNTIYNFINKVADDLSPSERNIFLRQSRILISKHLSSDIPIAANEASMPVGANLTLLFWYSTPQGMLFLALLILMWMMVALMLQSSNPKTRQQGLRWKRRVENIESMAGRDDAFAQTVQENKRMAREIRDRAKKGYDKCKQKHPEKGGNCIEALRELADRITFLTQKLDPSGRGGPAPKLDDLNRGITRNMRELWNAMRKVAEECTGCSDLMP